MKENNNINWNNMVMLGWTIYYQKENAILLTNKPNQTTGRFIVVDPDSLAIINTVEFKDKFSPLIYDSRDSAETELEYFRDNHVWYWSEAEVVELWLEN